MAQMIETQSASSHNDPIVALLRAESRLGVTGGKTPSEDMFSALTRIADIARSEFQNSADQRYCRSRVLRIMRSGPEQFRARLWRNNATRLSGIEWLWPAKRA